MRTHPILTDAADSGIRLGFEKLSDFLKSFCPDTLEKPAIHIAGTNGKGSTSAFLSAILFEAGIKAGRYTSPHLSNVNERIEVAGKHIDDAELHDLLVAISSAATEWVSKVESASGSPLTYFEFMTAAGLCHFENMNTGINVVEVGLGGRLDATNIVDSSVSVIVSIGFDHTDVLGMDLASIASEKAGIIRENIPVVVGKLPADALRIIRMIAYERNAPLYVLDTDFYMHPNDDNSWTFKWRDRVIDGLFPSLKGIHQGHNAGLAIMALQVLNSHQFPSRIIRKGIEQAKHPGRLEWITDNLLTDCAHNIDGANALASYLKTIPKVRPRTLLLGTSRGKDVRAVAVHLQPHFDRILTTHCEHPRAVNAGAVATEIAGLDIPVIPAGPVETVLQYIDLEQEEVVVAGSIFLVGALRMLIHSQ